MFKRASLSVESNIFTSENRVLSDIYPKKVNLYNENIDIYEIFGSRVVPLR